jgi:hypothetical protein
LISPLIVASLTIIFLIRVWFFKNRSTLKKIKRPHSYRDLSSFSHENDLTCLLWVTRGIPHVWSIYHIHVRSNIHFLVNQIDISQLYPNCCPIIIQVYRTIFQL